MSEPEAIADMVVAILSGARDLAGIRFLVTAGPTHEPIDRVRFLGNRSSGKMGFAVAAEAALRGASVVLVAGPVALPTPAGIERVDVTTALEMADAVASRAPTADVVVMAAAVADYRPAETVSGKLKREGRASLDLRLVQNPDILAGIESRAPAALRVGFAAETERVREHGERKLHAKRVDVLVVNDVSRSDIGFGSDDNAVLVLRPGRAPTELGKRSKTDLARALVDLLRDALEEKRAPAAPGVEDMP
jgi:phosphopantothenoylcysteine decarboxylase/phosphopantothenate--cysteine ligase